MEVKCLQSIKQIDINIYLEFFDTVKASIFYDYHFLLALEEKPLLPHLKTYYFSVQENGVLLGFLPIYVQTHVDPFGVLSESLNYEFENNTVAIFSHAMHVSDSCIPHVKENPQVIEVLLNALERLAEKKKVSFYGLLNLTAENIDVIQPHAIGWQVNSMWNRFSLDLRNFSTVKEIVSQLSADGRREANRQLRKFEQYKGEINWLSIGNVDLKEVARLCRETTIRNGTPYYYPPEAMCHLLEHSSAFTRIVEVRQQGVLAGVGIVFIDNHKLHLWAVGMDYTVASFSPYTLLYLDIYRFALENKINTIEAGRTTQRIKERLGLNSIPLYSITKKG